MAKEEEKAILAEEKVFEQPSLLDEIVQATKLKPTDEAYSLTRKGVEALISQLLEPGREAMKIS